MLNNKTKLIAKIDPLKYLLSKAALTGRITKWVMLLGKFDRVCGLESNQRSSYNRSIG